jgi:hypothetical protein
MKKVFISGLFLFQFISLALPQDKHAHEFVSLTFTQDRHAHEARFVKRIENNMYRGEYNLTGKGNLEKRFLGDFNARVEFFSNPDHNQDASGFRIVRKDLFYFLEIKYISNFDEIEKRFEDRLKPASISFTEARKIGEEKARLHRIDARSILITNQFAEKLYGSMFSLIKNYETTEVDHPDTVPTYMGGDPITFRTVVKAEVWSLFISWTQGDTRKMADLCREIIKDAKADRLDEKKYLSVLNTFENQ